MLRQWILAVVGLFALASCLVADPLQPNTPTAIRQYGGYALDLLAKRAKELPLTFEVDLNAGRGFHDGIEGVMVLPAKGLSVESIAKGAHGKPGAPLCYIFATQKYQILVDGKPIDRKKLHQYSFFSTDGEEKHSICLICTVRNTPKDGTEMCFFGESKDPIFTTKLNEVQQRSVTPLQFGPRQVQGDRVSVGFFFLGKYRASVDVAIVERSPDEDSAATIIRPDARRRAGKSAKIRTKVAEPFVSQFQFGMQRTGYVERTKLLGKQPRVVWKFPADSDSYPAMLGDPIVHDGVVYFGDAAGTLHALSATDGKQVWSRDFGGQQVIAAPVAAKDRLFFSSAGALHCVNRRNGESIWRQALFLPFPECSPLLVGDKVYLAANDGFLYVFSQQSGKPIWKSSLVSDPLPVLKGFEPAQLLSSGAVARPHSGASDGTMIFQTVLDQSRVLAFDCKTGERRWAFRAEGIIWPSPVVVDNYVLVGSEDLNLHCLDRLTGKPIWKLPTGSIVWAAPAVAENRVYCASCNGRVICAELKTGEQLWTFRTDAAFEGTRFVLCAPVVTDNTVYVASCDGSVSALDALSGKFRWQSYLANDAEIGSNHAASDSRRLFFVTRPYRTRFPKSALFALGE